VAVTEDASGGQSGGQEPASVAAVSTASTESETETAVGTTAETAVADAGDAGEPAVAVDAPSTEVPVGDEAEPADAVGEEAPTLYPAGAAERAAVNRVVSGLVRAIEARDSTAIARLFGGRIPEREWRMFSRMFEGPRVRIRYELGGVGTAENGMLVAEVENNIMFQGQPGRVPSPRRSTWIMRFQSDKTADSTAAGLTARPSAPSSVCRETQLHAARSSPGPAMYRRHSIVCAGSPRVLDSRPFTTRTNPGVSA
jgi:hypothetical protein